VLAARRQSLGLNFGVDAEGESNSAAFANLLLVEFGLGNQNVIWPYLAIADDPRIRSYFVHQFSYTGFDVRPLVDRVSDESDASIQYAILLAISQCSRKQLGEDSVAKIQAWLPNAYRTHPDCGVHSMCRWLMQQWGLEESLQAIDQQLREEGIVTGRNWYVNRLGMQMLIVNGPVDLVTHDLVLKGRTSTANAIQSRPYRIPRSFAIGTDAVTVGQYLQFQEDIQHDHDHPALLDPTTMASSPVDRVSWINAMDYCQWLSIQTGISESQAGNCVKIDLETVEVDYEKSGYRLPTKAEWEYSCRAGTITDCSYGTIDTPGRELYVAQSSEPSAITRAYLPNAYGMFACLGNASNMVSTSFSEASRNATSDPEKEIVSMRLGTYLFGGASMNRMSTSWNFFFNMPKVARANVGFRIAHTVTLTRNLP
jgi:formylglycine-generating enzyme required for sulfatase activity